MVIDVSGKTPWAWGVFGDATNISSGAALKYLKRSEPSRVASRTQPGMLATRTFGEVAKLRRAER